MTSPRSGDITVGVDFDTRDSPVKLDREMRHQAALITANFDDLTDKIEKALDRALASFAANVGQRTDLLSTEFDQLRDHILKNTRDLDKDLDRNALRRTGQRAGQDIAGGLTSVLGGGGLQDLITGPLGAFFNVGSRSPLALLLLPVFGAIVALVAALVQWISALTSLLFLIPSLLFAIGLQGLALFLIFKNVGTVLGQVFTADTPKELEAALKGVNSELAEFARNIYPWKKFFEDLQEAAQINFFEALNEGNDVEAILENIRKPLSRVIEEISSALGTAFREVLRAFSDKSFATLISVLGTSITEWLLGKDGGIGFGEAIGDLVQGLTDLGIALDPFLDWFGAGFNTLVSELGQRLSDLSADPDFLAWIEDMKPIIVDGLEFLGTLWELLKTFINQFNEADKSFQAEGDLSWLDTLTELTKIFIGILASPFGRDAMRGFIWALGSMFVAFEAIAVVVLAVFWIIDRFFRILVAIGEFIGNVWKPLFDGIDFAGPVTKLTAALEAIPSMLRNLGNIIIGWFTALFGDVGESIIDAFGDGISSAIHGTAFGSILATLGNMFGAVVPDFLEDGGGTKGVGTAVNNTKQGQGGGTPPPVDKWAIADLPAEKRNSIINNNSGDTISFDFGAIQVNYVGSLPPTEAQAKAIGSGVGTGIVDQIKGSRLKGRTQ